MATSSKLPHLLHFQYFPFLFAQYSYSFLVAVVVVSDLFFAIRFLNHIMLLSSIKSLAIYIENEKENKELRWNEKKCPNEMKNMQSFIYLLIPIWWLSFSSSVISLLA